MKTNIIHLALGYHNEIIAMWTKGYKQNYFEWKRACKSIGAYGFYSVKVKL